LLVVIDGAKALSSAVRAVFGASAAIQRCWFHLGPVAAAQAGDWTELDLRTFPVQVVASVEVADRQFLTNGTTTDEAGINALVAQHFGVPVVAIAGDQHVGSEAMPFCPGIRAAVVKESISRYAAPAICTRRPPAS
jgi:hypothetical protein